MGILLFDIETVALPIAEKFVVPKDPPSNWKDSKKIKAFKDASKKEKLDKAALDPDLCSIRAIGYRRGLEGDTKIHLVNDEADEVLAINEFWSVCSEVARTAHGLTQIVGFNILAFDFPVLLRRSMAHGLAPRWKPSLRRYVTEPVCDLYAIMYNWGPGKGLKWLCDRYGYEAKLPDVDGSMVADMDNETLTEYLLDDVDRVAYFYRMMEGIYF
jgi:hypothetical protein